VTNREKPGDDQSEARDELEEPAGQVVYAPLLEKQLAEESAIQSSFEQRGVTVITTSGVLVSLLFGLSAVVTDDNGFALPHASRVLLIVALVLFVLAAVSAIITNWPLNYFAVETEDLQRLINKGNWNGPPRIAAWRIAEAQVTILARARELNELKGRVLLVAMITQVLAVIALAAAVTCMLVGTN
jgi:hypothetical protein